ncbi:hypothetical protein BD779DRAFT_1667422 [Infundibulicybe gibba]|nr:hypothetical protein BD779DRAFT_1667422 [Infundibulicybe gibba]
MSKITFPTRFNPIFVLPISDTSTLSMVSQPTTPITKIPGRRTGTGSAAIQPPNRATSSRVPVLGFQEVSLLSMIRQIGQVPPFGPSYPGNYQPLEDIRKKADRPVVVFPECTTSNGRGILRFANIFQKNIPITSHQVFVMCVRFVIHIVRRVKIYAHDLRYDPPTSFAPTLTHSIPAVSLNPLYHIFTIATSLTIPSISIRLLAPSEGPSSPLFIASDVISGTPGEDQLGESCAVLISQIGKIKRTGMGWEDKASFLDFYRKKYQ